MVVKRDGRREPYDREKILQGLKIACRKRPVPTQTLEELVDGIEHKIHDLGLKEISSKEIGEEIISRLKEIDPIAYVRFASVYRSFTDAKEFIREIQEVLPSARDDQSTREPQARG
ncbi:MAG: Transcriptional repressor NrdR [Myxococcota bacterium]|nr:Transcriptional repressor NrdR [Myxococcota bacterium]